MSAPNIASLFLSQGLEPSCKSMHNGPASYFTPIQSEGREKVDILELLHKAKVDLKPLLSTLSVNKARLQESSECQFLKQKFKKFTRTDFILELILSWIFSRTIEDVLVLELINGYSLMFYAYDLTLSPELVQMFV